jgi:hypothetical protein
MDHTPSSTTVQPQQADAPTAPLAVMQFGRVSAAIFVNTLTGKNGKTFDAYSVSLRRAYRAADGKQGYTSSLRPTDLLPATYALLKCCDLIYKTDKPSSQKQR